MSFGLFEIIEASIRNCADRIAIVTPEGSAIRYRDVARIVDSCARQAYRGGVRQGDLVAIHAVSMTHCLLAILGLSRLGAIYARAPDEGARGIQAGFVIVDASSGLKGAKVVEMDFTAPDVGGIDEAAAFRGFSSPDQVCLVMATSGTTGTMKQLAVTRGLFDQMINDQNTFFAPLDQRILLQVPPTTMYGLEMALLTLRSGGTIVFPGHTYLTTASRLSEGQVDCIIASPAVYSRWLEHLRLEGIRLRSISRAFVTGSLASRALIKDIQDIICGNLLNPYGTSELGFCAGGHVDAVAGIEGGVGKLADWIEVRTLDTQGRELPKGSIGQLEFRMRPGRRIIPYLTGETVGASPQLECLVPGDLGSVTQDGILCLKGRSNDMLNLGGNKIAPSIVEDLVGAFLGAANAVCAVGVPGPGGFDETVIIVVTKDAERLKALPAHLSAAKLGLGRTYILSTKSFPLNDFGKVDRVKLREFAVAEVARRRTMNH